MGRLRAPTVGEHAAVHLANADCIKSMPVRLEKAVGISEEFVSVQSPHGYRDRKSASPVR